MPNSLVKKAQGSGDIPSCAPQEIDDLSCSIYTAVQISPLSFDVDVVFVRAPSLTYCVLVPAEALSSKWVNLITQQYSVEWSTVTSRSAITYSMLRKLSKSA